MWRRFSAVNDDDDGGQVDSYYSLVVFESPQVESEASGCEVAQGSRGEDRRSRDDDAKT